jgi:ketosteroid isomerase-like protein
MGTEEAQAFAAEWMDAWNSHDLERIVSHYADDVVFLSPLAQRIVGDGRITGLGPLRVYWARALGAQRDLHFELIRVLAGHDCLTILYRDHRGEDVAETLELGDDGKVVRSFACYG